MLYDKFKLKNSKTNILSKIDVLGSFDFTTCLISLDSLEIKDLEVLKNKKINLPEVNEKYRKIIPLAIHEYTHFIDATSTIWGFNHLIMMNDAYLSSDIITRDEKEFYKAKTFYNHMNRIKYPKYYTTIGKLEKKVKWRADPSVGILFGNNGQITEETIMFLRFSSISGEHIARSPISPVSILEASAMSNEILSELTLLRELSKDNFAVHLKFFTDKILSIIYNKELTEYSACVHMLANQQQCTDIIQAFRLVSIITRIVLNCTEAVFDKLIEHDKFKNIFSITKENPTYKRVQDGLRYRNIGVLYYLIVYGLPDNSFENLDEAIQGVEESINNLGISIDFIKESAIQYIDNNLEQLISSDIKSIAQLANSAKENFDTIDIMSTSLPFDKLNIPKVFLGDCSETFIFNNEKNGLSEFDLEMCFDELSKGESWVKRFSEGCL